MLIVNISPHIVIAKSKKTYGHRPKEREITTKIVEIAINKRSQKNDTEKETKLKSIQVPATSGKIIGPCQADNMHISHW